MYSRGVIFRIILAILLLAVLTAGGLAVYRAGWGQGYLAGSTVGTSEGLEPGLLVPGFRGHLYQPIYPGFGFPFFGFCLGLGLIFLIMFLVGGLLKPWRRRGLASHPHYGKWEYGPIPPWAKEWEKRRQKMAQDEPSDDDAPDEQESEH